MGYPVAMRYALLLLWVSWGCAPEGGGGDGVTNVFGGRDQGASPPGADEGVRPPPTPDPDDGVPPPPDPDDGVEPPPTPDPDDGVEPPPPPDAALPAPDMHVGPVGDCSEIGVDPCFSNYDCAADRRCADIGHEGEFVACCIPGARGNLAAGEPCGDDGEATCGSAICIEEDGDARCSDRCRDAGDCPAGLRLCAPIAFSGSDDSFCLPDGSSNCRAPQPGDILVDEILIDAVAPERDNEFVELVNTQGEPVALAGLVVRSNRGDSLSERVRFHSGCLAPGGRVALYEAVGGWIWNPAPVGAAEGETNAFSFSNSADFTFVIETDAGVEIDRAQGARALITEGVSVNRNPTATPGAPFARHDEVGAGPTSPGRAP